MCDSFASQARKGNLNLNNQTDSKVQATEKLAGEINPDNFTFQSNFNPNVKTEIKHENSDEDPLLVTNVRSLNEPSKSKQLPLKNAENINKNAKSQSECSNSESGNATNKPIRLGRLRYGCPICSEEMSNYSGMKSHILTHSDVKPEELYTCDYCGISLKKKGNLRNAHVEPIRRRFHAIIVGKWSISIVISKYSSE